MVTPDDVQRIATLQSNEGIVSAYVRVDPKRMYDRRHPLQEFKSAMKRFVQRTRDERLLEIAERERERIQQFLDEWTPEGRGLAIFSSRPAGIWEVVYLQVAVPSLVEVDTTSRTAFLARILDEYPRLVVALVQRDKGRIFIAEQRRADERAAIESEVPGRHDQGGWSQARFQRHVDFHIDVHLKKVVDELEALYYRKPFKLLAIGGPEESVNELRKLLPEPLARRVIGTFQVDFKHESESEILDRAREIFLDHERRSEEQIVAQVIDAAESGGQGVIGVDDTLYAVFEGRVRTLVLTEGARTEGNVCTSCGYFSSRDFEACPFCGGQAEKSSDIIERAVERAYLAGAHVETVFGEARQRLLDRGGIGGLLRY